MNRSTGSPLALGTSYLFGGFAEEYSGNEVKLRTKVIDFGHIEGNLLGRYLALTLPVHERQAGNGDLRRSLAPTVLNLGQTFFEDDEY